MILVVCASSSDRRVVCVARGKHDSTGPRAVVIHRRLCEQRRDARRATTTTNTTRATNDDEENTIDDEGSRRIDEKKRRGRFHWSEKLKRGGRREKAPPRRESEDTRDELRIDAESLFRCSENCGRIVSIFVDTRARRAIRARIYEHCRSEVEEEEEEERTVVRKKKMVWYMTDIYWYCYTSLQALLRFVR